MDVQQTRMVERWQAGPPVARYTALPELFPVGTLRLGGGLATDGLARSHSHDFPVLLYFEHGGCSMRIGDGEWRVEPGDVYTIAPGEVAELHAANGRSQVSQVSGWAVFFPPEVLGPGASRIFLSWRSHPLLFPFALGAAGGVHRVHVPPDNRAVWSERIRALESEMCQRREGYQDAAVSLLRLLLVEVARLAAELVGDLRLKDEPLLAAVFAFIEAHFREPISLKDVAQAVSLSPGHLTTIIRRKSGRTVLEWITERRLAEARRLLVETDLAVEDVGRRVGYVEAGYFVRTFRRAYSLTPASWRRAGRPQAPKRTPAIAEAAGPRSAGGASAREP